MAEYKLISADSHTNEVSGTWERVRRKYGDRAPQIVWDPSEEEHGPYLSIPEWETSLEGNNRESCAEGHAAEIRPFVRQTFICWAKTKLAAASCRGFSRGY